MDKPPEIESGNIEYKRQLINISENRFIGLRNQMLWRMNESFIKNNILEAIYYIGIEDNGTVSGLKSHEHKESITNLKKIVKSINAEIISTQVTCSNKGIFSKNIIKQSNMLRKKDIKIIVLGSSSSGKSTLISVLAHGHPDNGMGSAKELMLKYDHETKSGNTSSINYEIYGYDKNNNVINSSSNFLSSWSSIIEQSDKIISLIDTPGSPNYMKTTLFGILAHKPNFAIITIDGNNHELDDYTKNIINICDNILLSYVLVIIKYENNFNIKINDAIPISNITCEGYDKLHDIIKKLEPIKNNDNPTEFMINKLFDVHDIGNVMMGTCLNGNVSINDKLLIGSYNSNFYNATILSIHQKQIPVNNIYTGDTACIVVKLQDNIKLKKNMILISEDNMDNVVSSFNIILNKEITEDNILKVNSDIMIYTMNIQEKVKIINIRDNKISAIFNNNSQRYIKDFEHVIIEHNCNYLFGTIKKS